MMWYKNVVIILVTYNMMVDCAPRTPEIIEWNVENHFCGSSIPIVMGLICKLPESIPVQVEDTTINQRSRVRRGIVDDCCKSACTLIYMQSYCHEELVRISTDQPIIRYHRSQNTATIKIPKETTSTTVEGINN
ncbi:bombyxin B-12-like [Aphis craccivora]|uniref:Bombyxin B-12-like n=1 Tax=Aphis craccivora TaxID=307492 RepID=A0A6G0YJE5_APHCR|nr:bombyxin B-12-like [Aphis craccivora]